MPNKSIFISWIDPLPKTDPEPVLVSPDTNINNPQILSENKVLIMTKHEENNKNNGNWLLRFLSFCCFF